MRRVGNGGWPTKLVDTNNVPGKSAATGVRAMQADGKSAEDSLPIENRRSQGTAILAKAGLTQAPVTPEKDMWVCRMNRCVVGEPLAQRRFTADDYLNLTGRALKAGKRGAIPPDLVPILARLDLSVEDWLATLCGWRSMIGGALGPAAARVEETARERVGAESVSIVCEAAGGGVR